MVRENVRNFGRNAMMKAKLMLALAVVGAAAGVVNAAAFTPGNLAIYRVDGSGAALSNTGAAVFVDEYTPAGVLVQSIAMPSASAQGSAALIASGTATAEGFLTRSADGGSIMLTGYDRSLGGTGNISGTATTAVKRSVGRVTLGGAVAVNSYDVYSGNAIRGVASTDGDRFWLTGGTAGVFTGQLSGSTVSNIGLVSGATNVTNTRTIQVAGGDLVISLAQGTVPDKIGRVSPSLATTGPTSLVGLTGVTYPTGNSVYSVLLLDRSDSVAGLDTMYYVDDGAATNGLYKFSFDGSTWTARGQVALASSRGLTGVGSGASASLFVTNGSSLQLLVDGGGFDQPLAGTFSSIATAPSFSAFRGVTLAPIPEPAALGLLAPAALVLARRRK